MRRERGDRTRARVFAPPLLGCLLAAATIGCQSPPLVIVIPPEQYVIVDAPPVVLCPETLPLAPFVDGVVLVVHSGRTKRETVQRSIKQLQQIQGRVLGIVLNRKRYFIPDFIYRRL